MAGGRDTAPAPAPAPPSLLPRPLSVLVVLLRQPELAPLATVTLLLTLSWPGDCRSGEREVASSATHCSEH